MSDAAPAAGEHYIVPGEDNGRIPVLQVELNAIKESLHDLVEVMREHCKQDEETRTTVALLEREQSKHCRDLDALGEMVRDRASKTDVEELRSMIKNPWVIALGSGGTVGVILQVLPVIAKAIGGP